MDPSTATGVGSGVISGGWVYVWVVYGATWATVVGYVISLVLRTRTELRRNAEAGIAMPDSPSAT